MGSYRKHTKIRPITSDQLDVLIYQESIHLDQTLTSLNIAWADSGIDFAIQDAQGNTTLFQIKSTSPRPYKPPQESILACQFLQEPFEKVAEKSRRYLYLVALRILGDSELAEDAVQEALLKAWQDLLKQFETQRIVRLSGLSSWLNTIVRHVAIDILKREQRITSAGLLPDIPERQYYTTHPFQQPETALLHKESQTALSALIGSLPEKQQQAMLLFYVRDCSEADIAKTLCCSLNTVKSYLRRGRISLCKLVQRRHIQRDEIDVWSTTSLLDGTLWQFIPCPKDSLN